MSANWQLTLAPNQRITPLTLTLWQLGITPWSWIWQCPPDLYGVFECNEDRVLNAAHLALRELEHDLALQAEIERAEALFNAQGKTLFGPEQPE